MRRRGSLGCLLATLCASSAISFGDAQNLNLKWTGAVSKVNLNDGVAMPLIGIGVGNVPRESIADLIVHGVQKNGVRVIDTAHQSANEMLVAGAIRKAVVSESDTSVDVISKVWYTYLGSNRTRMSVRASLEELGLREAVSIVDAELTGKKKSAGRSRSLRTQDAIRVTMLLHWPRCYDGVPWMRCEQEEAELPAEVRVAGPPPHLRQNESWKESWRALEVLYKKGALDAIGVSNFDLEDLKELVAMAEVMPHMLQVSLYQYLIDKDLRQYVTTQQIPVQVFSAMYGALNKDKLAHAVAPREVLERIGQEKLGGVDVGAVLMKWLAQQKIMQIPKASSLQRLDMNAPEKILKLPNLSKEDMEAVEDAVIEIMQTQPPARARVLHQEAEQTPAPQGVSARFHNSLDRTLALYWISKDDGREVPLTELPPGTHLDEVSHPGHSFVGRFKEHQEGDKIYHFDIPQDSRPGMQHTFNVHREL